jgi:hypothetical protein
MPPKKNLYTFFDEFVLRTTSFSFNLYRELGGKKKIRKKEFLSIWNCPECKEALFLASPNFYSIGQDYIDDETQQDCNSVEFVLIKYIARMCSRATPFGLFAGIIKGEISENTAIELSKTAAFKRKSRLDMSFILALSQQLSKQESLQRQLRFFSNSSLYKTADHYRYIEYAVKNTNIKIHLNELFPKNHTKTA